MVPRVAAVYLESSSTPLRQTGHSWVNWLRGDLAPTVSKSSGRIYVSWFLQYLGAYQCGRLKLILPLEADHDQELPLSVYADCMAGSIPRRFSSLSSETTLPVDGCKLQYLVRSQGHRAYVRPRSLLNSTFVPLPARGFDDSAHLTAPQSVGGSSPAVHGPTESRFQTFQASKPNCHNR